MPSALARIAALAAAVACSSCANAPIAAVPAPVRAPAPAVAPPAAPAAPVVAGPVRPSLPPFSKVTGALALDMVSPADGYVMSVRESTFVFGSVGNGDATLTINGAPVQVNPNGSFMAYLAVPADSAYVMRASLPSGESTTATRRIRFPRREPTPRAPAVIDTVGYPRLVTLANTNEYATADTDMVTVARPVPNGAYKWFLLPRTAVLATGKLGASTRVRLDSQLEAWVSGDGIANAEAPRDSAAAAHVRRISAARVASIAGYSDLVLSMDARAPFAVDASGNRVSLTLYSTRANLDLLRYDTSDPTVRLVRHEQVASDRVRFDIDLAHPAVGYQVLWRANAMVLRIRHLPPDLDETSPLRGRIIAVDPGHPPGGATGPTRLWEPEATLAVGEQLKELLESRGARVIMLRSAMGAVPLGARPIEARRANAEAFVSIHLNAFADGANPFAAARGSGTYFFHPQSESLARFIQQGLVQRLGLRDEGIFFDNLAVARATWFPSVLCEGAWVVMPEQESALRTVEFQRAYAQGIVEGLERYFANLGASARQDASNYDRQAQTRAASQRVPRAAR